MKEVPMLIEVDGPHEVGSPIIFCSSECMRVYQDMEQSSAFVDDVTDASALYQVFCALCGRLITADHEDHHV